MTECIFVNDRLQSRPLVGHYRTVSLFNLNPVGATSSKHSKIYDFLVMANGSLPEVGRAMATLATTNASPLDLSTDTK
jgi:hypothetical protein